MDMPSNKPVVYVHNGVVQEGREAIHHRVLKGEKIALRFGAFVPRSPVRAKDRNVGWALDSHPGPEVIQQLFVGPSEAEGLSL
jgi:hypothetical protein